MAAPSCILFTTQASLNLDRNPMIVIVSNELSCWGFVCANRRVDILAHLSDDSWNPYVHI